VGDALRTFRMSNMEREDLAKHLSKYFQSDNPNFKESVFVNYVMGRGGARPGSKFKGQPPVGTELLF
jgi:hypothetical protein